MKILIVGGVAGGASTAARLRRLDEKAEIIMFDKGPYISFANCGLPYYIGDVIKRQESLLLHTPESFSGRFNVDVRVLSEVYEIDKENKTVMVKNLKTGETYKESYDKLVLSPGASPVVPGSLAGDSHRVLSLRTIEDSENIKKQIKAANGGHAVVVGGGYIGLEMVENLVLAGIKVTVVEAANHVIASLDRDMASFVHQYLVSKGVELKLNSLVESIEEVGDKLKLTYKGGEIETDFVIMSIGVTPDSEIADKAGIELNPDFRNAIKTNENMETNDPDIYAIGDAISTKNYVTKGDCFIPLAGPANKQGRIVADRISGIDSKYKGTQGTAILKLFDITVANTGVNESQAKAAGLDYEYIYLSPLNHAGYYPGASNLFMKIIYEKKTGKILGGQFVGGDGVDKRNDILSTVIRFNGTAHDLTQLELSYAPPFGSAKDPLNMAGYAIENRMSGLVESVLLEDIPIETDLDNINLVSLCQPQDFAVFGLEGFINIPFAHLRERMSELDKDKPVYFCCYSSVTSYMACRMLSQHGYKCYNILEGANFYTTIIKDYTEFGR